MATLKEVARSAGVSIRTVSLVLNGDYRANRISDRRAKMVQSIAGRMAYRPNSAARAMLKGRFGSVAMVLSTDAETSYMPQQLLGGIQEELARHGLNLIVTSVPEKQLASTGPAPRILRERMADGLILNYQYKIPPRLAELVEDRHLPAVWTNVKKPTDAAYVDDFGGAIQATQHLLQLGHRHIAYADLFVSRQKLTTAHYSTLDRQAGYEAAMRKVGLEPVVIRSPSGTDQHTGLLLARATLASTDRPTALLGYSAETVGTMGFVAAGLGMILPRDLSLVSFGLPWVSPIGLDLCIVELPLTKLGHEVARMAVRKIDIPLEHLPSEAVACRLTPARSATSPGAM